MSNMSYCMFENTYNDLKDCVIAMQEATLFEDLDLSEYEKDAYIKMRALCERFVERYDDLSETMYCEID